ncbi:hypothetical protein HZB06_02000, partial [Candidatus Wolfebacteria bacterium]|nr:hypothetical protein [Candidatus Wolfebacteria bacterium]
PIGEGGGHQTGGAVDVTLGDVDGKELFLGTEIHGFSDKTPINSKNIAKNDKIKREILCNAMMKAGFVNYPAEWWHYSFGDKLWAAYSRKKKAFYGPVNIRG